MSEMNCPSKLSGDPRFVGDPVNVITGANTDRGLDFRLEGPLPLEWYRYYDSGQSHRRRTLGWGHGHEFDRWLRFDLDGIRYSAQDGSEIAFPFLEVDGAKCARDGVALERVEKGLYHVRQGRKPAAEFRFNFFDKPVPVSRVFLGKHAITLKYGDGYRLESVLDSLGRWIQLKYDDAARTLTFLLHESVDKPARAILGYRFDAAGNLVEAIDAYRNAFSFRWDARNRMIARTDRRDYTFLFEYDQAGRCVRSAGEDGVEEVRLSYRAGEGITEVTRGDGGQWTYFHDETGFLYQIIDPYGGVKAFKADDVKRVTEEIDPNGNATKVVYDEAGEPVGKVTPFGQFAPQGAETPNPLEHRVPATPLQYELGDLLQGEAIQPPTWKSDVLEVLPPVLQRHFRIVERPLPEPGQDPYEAEAAALAGIAPYRPVKDIFGQVTKEAAPGRPARAWAYDKNGNVSAHRDLDGRVTRYEFASWNHLVKELDPLGRETRYAYNQAEKLTRVIGPGGAKSEYDYDLKNRLTQVKRHGKVRETYEYDAADNLIGKRDGAGNTLLSMEIGAGNQLKTRRLASGDNHYFKYDARGRYVEAATDAFKVTFAYDEAGNRTEDVRDGRGVRHRYDGLQLAETVVLDRFSIAYERKGADSLAIRLPGGKSIRVKFLGNGMVLRDLPNGSREWLQYDREGRALSKVASGPERYGQEWVRRYVYSDDGDLLEEMDTRYGTVGYGYDAAHRLQSETLPNGSRTAYVHDAGDNLVEQPGLSGVTLQEGNRLATANGDRFEYDERNHLATRIGATGETRYGYDSRGFLTGVAADGRTWSAAYDPLGRRVSKTQDGKSWEFFYDSDRLAAEIDPQGRLRVYVYPDAFSLVPVAFLDYANVDADPASAKAYYVFTNHLGAPTLVEDEAGHAVWNARLEPYGRAQLALGKDFHMPLRFPGHYFDAETGLHYNRFRYYSPELGRYLQSDPEGIAGGLNLYGYAEGNPLRWVDVRGLNCPTHGDKPDPACQDCKDAEKAKKYALWKQQRKEQNIKVKLNEKIKEAEAKGKLNDLDPADQNFLNNDPTGRNKELAYDPDTGSFKPQEAKVALKAEADGVLDGPVRRDFDESGKGSGGDIIDGNGTVWDVKDSSAGADKIADVAKSGENVLVDCTKMSPADQAALEKQIEGLLNGSQGAGPVKFVK